MAFLRTLHPKIRSLWVSLTLLVILAPPPQARGDDDREYALKATFLYHFCQFIDWPAGTFASSSAPITIGILGRNPFGSLLSETVRGEAVRNQPIRLEYYRRAEEALHCQILFISDSENWHLADILSTLRGSSVVTVGESDDFISAGGMIALIAAQNRVHLRINTTAVRAARVGMSSKLLRVAETR